MEKNILIKKMFTNGLNMGLLLEKTIHWEEAHWLSDQKKFRTQQSLKKVTLIVFLYI